jgi:hypothetical protein
MEKKLMMYRGYVFVFVLMTLLSSCRDKKERAKEENVDTIVLQPGGNMIINDPSFLWGSLVDLQDSVLYVKATSQEKMINIYLVKGDSLNIRDRFLTKGNGPYEVNGFATVYDKESKTLSFFENRGILTKGYQVDMEKKDGIHDKASWRVFDFSPIGGNLCIGRGFAYVSDTLLLSVGGRFYNKELLTLINLNDYTLTHLDFWPDDGFEENHVVKQGIYTDNAQVFKNSKLNKYLYVADMGKYMEIFSMENKQIINRLPVCKIYPKYRAAEDGLNYRIEAEEMNRGLDVYTTDSLIYAKPIEYTAEMSLSGQDFEGYDLYYGKIINVYDWNGNLIKRYETDIPFNTFVVNAANNLLYVQTSDLETGDPLIRRYKLPAGESKKR